MCGLAGRFRPQGLPPDPEWQVRAQRLLAHRGPDGSGCYQDERCELVHRRLALLDLSSNGRQPLANEDGSVQVVYNGEIYNHLVLRSRLERRGHRFHSTTDTEVLVHLDEEEGDDLVEELRGIFAFALYDRRRRRVLLARDRFGVKPLFYAHLGGQWVFASEIKAIAALDDFRPELDRQACYDFLALGYVPEPATGFANVRALPAGTCLALTPDGPRERRYHQVTAVPRAHQDLAGAATKLEERLAGAVRAQSVADVPVAALLSGGIDSSLVVAARCRSTQRPTTTFNVRFPDPTYDETDAALAVSRRYRTAHHVIDLGDWALTPDALFDLFRHFDQPFADTSLIPMHWISRAVRERGIICTLSGDGGDEAFGGYAHFSRAGLIARLGRLPEPALALAQSAGRAAQRWSRDGGRQLAKAAGLARAGRARSAAVLAGLSAYLGEEEKRQLVPAECRAGLLPLDRLFEEPVPTGRSSIEHLSRRLTETMFAISLPSDMLRKVDMMSMRAGIEVRVPLLDEEVVELGTSLPHRLKTDRGTSKRVLRTVADRWLPPAVARRPKQGFSIPLDVMVPRGVHPALEELLLSDDARSGAFLNRSMLVRWLAGFRAAAQRPSGGAISRGGLYQRIFNVLALELWLREYALAW